mmetsp:Transcript_24268/g.77916  ORF Transcript_24268/g.77916 Transcript_24268/m.77916 type:complete len:297 (-) Transcript_24268:65-955(-)
MWSALAPEEHQFPRRGGDTADAFRLHPSIVPIARSLVTFHGGAGTGAASVALIRASPRNTAGAQARTARARRWAAGGAARSPGCPLWTILSSTSHVHRELELPAAALAAASAASATAASLAMLAAAEIEDSCQAPPRVPASVFHVTAIAFRHGGRVRSVCIVCVAAADATIALLAAASARHTWRATNLVHVTAVPRPSADVQCCLHKPTSTQPAVPSGPGSTGASSAPGAACTHPSQPLQPTIDLEWQQAEMATQEIQAQQCVRRARLRYGCCASVTLTHLPRRPSLHKLATQCQL